MVTTNDRALDRDITSERLTAHATLGVAVWLASQTEAYATWFVADIRNYFLPPIALKQCKVYFRKKSPIAFVSWGWFDEKTEDEWVGKNRVIIKNDWNSGQFLWITDFIAPFGNVPQIISDLRSIKPVKYAFSKRNISDKTSCRTTVWR